MNIPFTQSLNICCLCSANLFSTAAWFLNRNHSNISFISVHRERVSELKYLQTHITFTHRTHQMLINVANRMGKENMKRSEEAQKKKNDENEQKKIK